MAYNETPMKGHKMFNPITYIKDVIDILKDGGPGEALNACEITPGNKEIIVESLEPRARNYANVGDFFVQFENLVTIVPAKDFRKHYDFVTPPKDELDLTPVKTIKPI